MKAFLQPQLLQQRLNGVVMFVIVTLVLMFRASFVEASTTPPQLNNVLAKAHLRTCLGHSGRCNSSSTGPIPTSTTVFSVRSAGIAVQVDLLGAEANATANHYAIFPDFPFVASVVGHVTLWRESGFSTTCKCLRLCSAPFCACRLTHLIRPNQQVYPLARAIIDLHGGDAQVVIPTPRNFGNSQGGARPVDNDNSNSENRYWDYVEDAKDVLSGFGHAKYHIVAHGPWGGSIAWGLAFEHPQLVSSLHAVNAPHPSVFRKLLEDSADRTTFLKSGYVRMLMEPKVTLEKACPGPPPLDCRGAPSIVNDYLSKGGSKATVEQAGIFFRSLCRRSAADHLGFNCGNVRKPVGVVGTPVSVIYGTNDMFSNADAAIEKLPEHASNVSRVKRIEFEGHDLLERDPCFVAKNVASFAWEVVNGISGNPFPFSESSKPENIGGVLTKYAIADANAVCMDGSTAVYYKAESGSGSKHWLIYFEGADEGGPMACTTALECAAWMSLNPHLSGSTTAQGALALPSTLPGSGILSQDACENPVSFGN